MRCRRDTSVECSDALLEAGELLARSADKGVGERVVAIAQAVDEDLRDEILALLANGQCPLDIAALHRLEHFLDHRWLATRVFTNDKDNTFNHDRDHDERHQGHGPHDFFAFDEEVHRRGITEEKREGEALDDHRRKVDFLLSEVRVFGTGRMSELGSLRCQAEFAAITGLAVAPSVPSWSAERSVVECDFSICAEAFSGEVI